MSTGTNSSNSGNGSHEHHSHHHVQQSQTQQGILIFILIFSPISFSLSLWILYEIILYPKLYIVTALMLLLKIICLICTFLDE